MPPQGRLGDKASAQADAHGCPACPHAVQGPGILGSPNVFVNQRPALRVSDKGVHAACCVGNTWTAQAGSATVFINGKAAHRVGDLTMHCGGTGKLAEGSSDVFVGDGGSAGGGGPSPPSVAGVTMPKTARPGVPVLIKLAGLIAQGPPMAPGQGPPPIRLDLSKPPPVVWTVDGERRPERGPTLALSFGKEHAGRRIPITAQLGTGTTRHETSIAVPKLTIEGPDTVEVEDRIDLVARLAPDEKGTYVWFDKRGKKIGEGPRLTFVGKEKSKQKGDQPVECRFTARDDGTELREKHEITVEKTPKLSLPINITLDKAAATRWLRDNPIEVRVDDRLVGSHAMVTDNGKIVVSFSARPGEHTVVVSSGPRFMAGSRPPLRLIHFSSRVKVTPTD